MVDEIQESIKRINKSLDSVCCNCDHDSHDCVCCSVPNENNKKYKNMWRKLYFDIAGKFDGYTVQRFREIMKGIEDENP